MKSIQFSVIIQHTSKPKSLYTMPAITRSRSHIRPSLRYRPYVAIANVAPKPLEDLTLDELVHRVKWQGIQVERTECDHFIVYKAYDVADLVVVDRPTYPLILQPSTSILKVL